MQLDAFDLEVKNASGDAQDILYQFYGKKIGKSNAIKQLAGIRTHLDYKACNTLDDRQIGELEETVIKADGTVTSKRLLLLSEEESQDPKRIMELMGFDILQWELVSLKKRRNYWDVSMKLHQGFDEKGQRLAEVPHKVTNHAFECTITVKPIQQILSSEMIQKLFDELPAPNLCIYRAIPKAYKLLEFPIMDLHLGKYAEKDGCGSVWNMEIAEHTFEHVVIQVLHKIELYGIQVEKIILPIGNDFFHIDNIKGTTTAGTVMDIDTSPQNIFKSGVKLWIWAIENLRRIAPVECILVFGNHDEILSFCLANTLNAYFRNSDDVVVDLSTYPRKYVHYGNNLIGLSHGSDEGNRIKGLMQVEQPEAWGNSKYREWHLAHLHKEDVFEDGGVIIRRIPSVTSSDRWHSKKGYVGAIRKVPIFIWDKENGKDMTIDINISSMEVP